MAIDWLRELSEFAELGRRRLEARLSEFDGLPRGQYLRLKRDLMAEWPVSFYRSTSPALTRSETAGIGTVPSELSALLSWSDGLLSPAGVEPVLGVQVFGIAGIREYRTAGNNLVDRDGLFPPVFKKLLIFGNDFGHRLLAVWSSDQIVRSPVLLVDMAEREILIVSHSLDLFFQRISFSLAREIPFRIGSRSKQLREFIAESEPGAVYPPKVRRQTRFSLDKVKDFADAWQPLLSEEDRAFRIE